MSDDNEDAWDAFGSDSEDDGGAAADEEELAAESSKVSSPFANAANAIATHLVQMFMKQNSDIPLSDRKVLVLNPGGGGDGDSLLSPEAANELHQCITTTFLGRQIQAYLQNIDDKETIFPAMDAIVCIGISGDEASRCLVSEIQGCLCPGGTQLLNIPEGVLKWDAAALNLSPYPERVTSVNGSPVVSFKIPSIQVHTKNTCPWLPQPFIPQEKSNLQEATVVLSAEETLSSRLSQQTIKKAVHALQTCGYCILPGLLDKKDCHEWGQAVLESVHQAANILNERDIVDIYHPHSSQFEPQSYQELSMREDLRLDIRQGPPLWKLRKEKGDDKGNESVVIKASDQDYSNGIFLRGHPSILEVIRQTMNPHDSKKELWKGNMGRWNFGGSGADGSYQDLRLSPVGGIVSLPGAADQALHADTPHLFENFAKLPAHYINVFAPCTPFDEQVGGTAFIHGSHNLEFTAKYCGDDGMGGDNSKVYPFLVRPKLNMGDVILFDCRILHFGLANTSDSVERCICYTNTWQNWFHDAKNWDQNRAIFERDGKETED